MIDLQFALLTFLSLEPKCEFQLYPTVQYSNRDSSHPYSVAVGRFNSDRHMDIVVANFGFDNVTVFLSNGNNSFSYQTTYSTSIGSAPRMVAVGDFNNDTRLDIVVANFGINNLVILFGNGDGAFSSRIQIETGSSRPIYVVVDDFNNDQYSDIAFLGYGTNLVGVLLGLGNGAFQRSIEFSTGFDSLPHSIAVGDLNNDGRKDIAVANYGTDNIGLFLGNGDGTFTSQMTFTTGINSGPYSIAMADLNNDTHLDIAVIYSDQNNIAVFFGYGNEIISRSQLYSTGKNSQPIFIAIADFNNDQKPDIAVTNNGSDSVMLLLGSGNGSFANPIAYSTGPRSSPYSVGIGDFNDDNQLDIAIANHENNNVKIFNSQNTKKLGQEKLFPTDSRFSSNAISFISTGTGSGPSALAIGDFNGDHRLDIVIANSATDNIGVSLGYGSGEFSSQMVYSTGADSRPVAVVVGDFNNDVILDIAVANFRVDAIWVFLGYGNGSFSLQKILSTGVGSGPYSLAIDDFNKDAHLDIAVVNSKTSTLGIFLGYGNGEFSNQTVYSTGVDSTPSSIIVADFNKDNRQDLAVTNYRTNNIAVFIGYGNGSFRSPLVLSTGDESNPSAIAVGDLNNDGLSDIAVACSGTNKIAIFLGRSKGRFSLPSMYSTGDYSNPISIVIGDFSNDSRLDIAVANYGADNIGILMGYGNGRFSPQTTFSTGAYSGPYAIKTVDFNNDDRLDIAVANSWRDNVAILLAQSTGNFPTIIYPSTTDFCLNLVAVGDVNSDKRSDVVTADYDTNTISVLLGDGSGNFANLSVMSTGDGSRPSSLGLGDFNNDGWLDIVITSSGTNNIGISLGYGNGEFQPPITYDTGYSFRLIALAIGDANNDGRLDIFVLDQLADSVGVFIGYGNGNFSPATIYEIGYSSQVASIIVADFNNDGRLDFAVAKLAADNVGVLFGLGNGTFQSERILSTGTYTHPMSLAAADFNNDGNMDIAVGNTLTLEEHILILLGDGTGNFSNHGKYITQTNSPICSLLVTDFGNDGLLDIAMVSKSTKEIGIFFGYGDGTFSSQTNYPTGKNSNPMAIAAADFNNDSLTDLAVANHGKSFVSVFQAFIDTNFVDRSTYFTGAAAFPAGIVLGDFTNDSHLDIVIGNDGTHDISTLINGGNGKFSMQTAFSGDSTFYPTFIVATDFNNDKHLDIAVANSVMDTLILLSGQGNGTFAQSTTLATQPQSTPKSLVVGDFNRDNKTDIVVAQSNGGSVGLFLKVDNGALKKFGTLSTGSFSKPHVLAVADFDNDGCLDIAAANNGNANIGVFFGLGDGTFIDQKVIPLQENIHPIWVGSGDFNNDKNIDIVISNNVSPTPVIVLLSNGDRSFRIMMTEGIDAAEMGAVGDFNKDGLLDVVLCQTYADATAVLLGYGNGTFGDQQVYSSGQAPSAIIADDFNNDGQLDLVIVNKGSSNVAIMLGHGNGTFSDATTYSTADYGIPYSSTSGDFNDDGWVDVAIGMSEESYIGILFGRGNGTFTPFTPYLTKSIALHQSIMSGDFNNDGRLDIVVTETNLNKIAIILGHVNGTFFNEITYSTGNYSYPYSVAVGDFNKDARLDVVVANMLSDDIGIFLGYINEDFVSTAVRPISSSSQPVSIVAEDFDNDNCLDIVVADRKNDEIVIIRGSGYGTFLDQKTYSTGKDSSPSWIAVDDFNHDQYLDIAVVNSGTNSIGILLGYGNGTFSSLLTSSSDQLSLPVSLCFGHFDNGTHLDIAVASTGNNHVCILFGYGNGSFGNVECRTSGYDSRPSAVICGDVNGDHTTDIVIANKGSSTIEILTKIC